MSAASTQPPVPDAISYQRCNIPFYRAGSSPAYLCGKLRDHHGPHSGDIMAFPFRCHICSNEAPYRCLGCESNYCRVHMAEHVLGTQERELEMHYQAIKTETQKWASRYSDEHLLRDDCEATIRAQQKTIDHMDNQIRKLRIYYREHEGLLESEIDMENLR